MVSLYNAPELRWFVVAPTSMVLRSKTWCKTLMMLGIQTWCSMPVAAERSRRVTVSSHSRLEVQELSGPAAGRLSSVEVDGRHGHVRKATTPVLDACPLPIILLETRHCDLLQDPAGSGGTRRPATESD